MSYLFYYFISDIVIYLIYIDLMRKRCQLINVDVGGNGLSFGCNVWGAFSV